MLLTMKCKIDCYINLNDKKNLTVMILYDMMMLTSYSLREWYYERNMLYR